MPRSSSAGSAARRSTVVVQPLVGRIYTADPNELSVKATLPQFLTMEKEHGSLILAAWRQARKARWVEKNASGARYGMFVTLADGMDSLPKALAAALAARGSVRTGNDGPSPEPQQTGLAPGSSSSFRRPAHRGRRAGRACGHRGRTPRPD